KLCVDFVIRYENLSEDLAAVGKKIGLPTFDLPHLKTGFRQKRHHYSEYFDEQSKAIVAEKHKNDIKFFGYEFEQV
ncbi:MAG: sulfotransferase, partial [Gammaproteobacteria bacterium]|nr:sulfotransferase [Gammaproteobacteria bacterium]